MGENLSEGPSRELKRGNWYALSAYTAWGFFPAYWHLLKAFPAFEILSHRILWSFAFYWTLLGWRTKGRSSVSWLKLFKNREARNLILLASVFISTNWCLYIYAVTHGHILEASLGYFITPLLNVGMGRIILNERLTPLRWTAMALAAAGVMVLVVQAGQVPVIALSLAFTFATYGLIRKKIKADVFEASTAETAAVVIPALITALYLRFGAENPVPMGAADLFFLIGGGIVTGIPLVWFAQAARLLPLSRLGFFQYIAPSIQFVLGVWVYGEPFTQAKLYAFAFIWAALGVFTYESTRRQV